MDDKKKPISVIVAKLKKPADMSEPEKNEMGDEVDSSMPKEAAAEELMSAIKSGSAKGVVEALESLMELCSGNSEE